MMPAVAPWGLAAIVLGVLLVLLVVGVVAYRSWRRRRARVARVRQVASASVAFLQDVVLPEAADGGFHLDFLMRTRQAIVVLEVREVVGRIYGGEHMPEWTVIGKDRRHTFENPTHRLYDRLAAVRGCVGDEVPLEGRIVFAGRPEFPKGRPPHVAVLDELSLDFACAPEEVEPGLADRLEAAWLVLTATATPSVAYR